MVPRVYLKGGITHASRRRAISASSTLTLISRFSASIVMMSPSLTIPMGPPTCASGATCPTQKPWLPPEKRPSVMSATSCPQGVERHSIAERCRPGAHDDGRGVEHLFHARPALGPLVPDDDDAALELRRVIRHGLHHVFLLVEAARGPDEPGPLLTRDLAHGELGRQCVTPFCPPAYLPTNLLTHALTCRMAMWPVGLTGLSKVETIFCPSTSGGQSARFSAIVLPACCKAAESAPGGQGGELWRHQDGTHA
eukprot:scaffold61022_cov51-Phaeocystis_antarctica.AAC.1